MVIFNSYVKLPEGTVYIIKLWPILKSPLNGPNMAYDNLIYTYLVGGFKLLDYFPFHIWNVILPIDFHIFQDG